MAVGVLSKMIHRTGRCPLPVHDSFLVPELDAHILRETMMEIQGNSDSACDTRKSDSPTCSDSWPGAQSPPVPDL